MRNRHPDNVESSGVGLVYRSMGNSPGKRTFKFSHIRPKTQCENMGLMDVEIQTDIPIFPSFRS